MATTGRAQRWPYREL